MNKTITVYHIEYEWVDENNEEGLSSHFKYVTPEPLETCYEHILNKICQRHKYITWESLFTSYFDMTIQVERVIQG
jgi:hypothetical protein